jgi:hypothetical protein
LGSPCIGATNFKDGLCIGSCTAQGIPHMAGCNIYQDNCAPGYYANNDGRTGPDSDCQCTCEKEEEGRKKRRMGSIE